MPDVAARFDVSDVEAALTDLRVLAKNIRTVIDINSNAYMRGYCDSLTDKEADRTHMFAYFKEKLGRG